MGLSSATASQPGENSGAGINCKNSSNIEIAHSNFLKNKAVYAGAISIESSTASVSDCLFTENLGRWGGAVYADNSLLDMENCQFQNNKWNVKEGLFRRRHSHG